MADVIDKELAKRVGMNITNLLILNGKTQKEMCDHFGWGYSTVSSWCNGTRLPRMDKVDKMCEYFGVSRSEILEDRKKSFCLPSVAIPVNKDIKKEADPSACPYAKRLPGRCHAHIYTFT